MKYWLMKSEPEDFSIEDLRRVGEEPWSGVRNYQARNFMKDDMRVGDKVLFYHSSCKVPGVYGLATVSHLAEPDATQFDAKSEYYDARPTRAKPWWYAVRVRYSKTLAKPVTLSVIRKENKLAGMMLFKNGRLSVIPVTKAEYERVLALVG